MKLVKLLNELEWVLLYNGSADKEVRIVNEGGEDIQIIIAPTGVNPQQASIQIPYMTLTTKKQFYADTTILVPATYFLYARVVSNAGVICLPNEPQQS